ncbi:hypothetical protein F53441_8841 [Fusarium austroafricanum]|uniref:Uncharacterized protein n=1 Tax=Fusarium austroafricanum TaxID=2364996 RepID=A0A8H4KAE4_9HYPO|nr:hypothetical protein F53441_8841 [Fusarium austroafricanum]
MDLCITAEEPFACEPPRSKSFPSPDDKTSTAGSPAPLAHTSPVSKLEFDLIVHDPSNDSALTYPWDLPSKPLSIPFDTSRVHLLTLLREKLPVPEASNKSRLGRHVRRPKLAAAMLYWTYRGTILPLGPNDKEWHYRDLVTKTDVMTRSELEWYLLKEMMASSGGALKCFIAIRGEALPDKISGWWFGGNA